MRAASLSFISLLALVPLSAVLFSVFSSFSAFDSIYESIQEFIIRQIFPTAQVQITEGLRTFVENARSLGVAGLLFFIATSVFLFNAVSRVFNLVWGCTYRKPFLARFTTYVSVIVLASLLMGTGISLSAAVGIPRMPIVLNEILNRVFTWAIFLILIMLVPSGKVRFPTAAAGAAVGTVLWEVSRVLFIYWTSSVMNVSVIYGSLAAVPILLIWLYVAWNITLFALETSFVLQHRVKPDIRLTKRRFAPSVGLNRGVTLFLFIAKRYKGGRGPTSLQQCAFELALQEKEILELAGRLTGAGLLTEISDTAESYIPARPLETVRMAEVFSAVFGYPLIHGREEDGTELPGPANLDPAGKLLAVFLRKGTRGLGAVTAEDVLRGSFEGADA